MKRPGPGLIYYTGAGLFCLFFSLRAVGHNWTEAIYWLLLTLWNFHQIDRLLDKQDRQHAPNNFYVRVNGEAPEGVTRLANKRQGGGL